MHCQVDWTRKERSNQKVEENKPCFKIQSHIGRDQVKETYTCYLGKKAKSCDGFATEVKAIMILPKNISQCIYMSYVKVVESNDLERIR